MTSELPSPGLEAIYVISAYPNEGKISHVGCTLLFVQEIPSTHTKSRIWLQKHGFKEYVPALDTHEQEMVVPT